MQSVSSSWRGSNCTGLTAPPSASSRDGPEFAADFDVPQRDAFDAMSLRLMNDVRSIASATIGVSPIEHRLD
jgi:hypothetical protein